LVHLLFLRLHWNWHKKGPHPLASFVSVFLPWTRAPLSELSARDEGEQDEQKSSHSLYSFFREREGGAKLSNNAIEHRCQGHRFVAPALPEVVSDGFAIRSYALDFRSQSLVLLGETLDAIRSSGEHIAFRVEAIPVAVLVLFAATAPVQAV
jgi:hypothetical protein